MPPVAVGFHLKFELYSSPAGNKSSNSITTANTKATFASEHDCFLPPRGTDIFKADLPAHFVSSWRRGEGVETVKDKSQAKEDTVKGTKSPPRENNFGALHTTPPHGSSQRQSSPLASSHGDALLLPERSLNLRRDVFPTTPPRRVILSNDAAARDWRYGKVEIESIDMEVSSGKGKSGVGGNGGGMLVQTKAVYRPSEPKTTEVGWGVVHLYRGEEEDGVGLEGRKRPDDSEEEFKLEDCTTLCILAVPSWMMPSDLLGFVGDQAREDISHFRLIRTGRANKYLVLMKFRSAKRARDWQKAYNGRLFSSAEPENCHVVFVKSVEFATEDDATLTADRSSANFPHNTHDPFTTVSTSTRSDKSLSSTTKPLAPPPPNLLELPTCPVCLERMDETTGLLTILCQHVFHCACLEKWRGSGCPVCRYTHSPSYTFPFPRPDTSSDPTDADPAPACSTCGQEENLWICLICGSIGCGRYDSAHAFAHYEETSHCYAMDINTQHVWDYAGDGYVHRLIQSKPPSDPTSTTMLPPTTTRRHENEAFRSEPSDSVPREKMESMAAEYTYLLTSQLEGQRRYFEEQVERAILKSHSASSLAEKAAASAAAAQSAAETAISERREMEDILAQVRKGAEKAEASRAKFETLARGLGKQVREEKVVSEGLMERVKALQGQVEGLKVEVEKEKAGRVECEELNRDLTAFIEGQEQVKRLEEAGEEIDEVGVVKGKGKGRRKK